MVLERPLYRPPAAPQPRRQSQAVYWRRRAITVLAVVTIVVVGYLGVTLGFALMNQSYGASFSARAAEWGRQHSLGGFVTWVESEWYKLNPPKVGGRPPAGSFGVGPTAVKVPAAGHLPAPVRIATPAGTPLAGEGVWHVVGRRTAPGIPTTYEAFVRPDPVHTSYVVGVVWMDPTLLRAQLYSGSYIPGGGPYTYSAPITTSASRTLVSAFNAGFRMQDANGGYYTDGKTIIPLRVGAASAVVMKDGTLTVGAWGSKGLTMSSQVKSVRQNLDPIVQNGQLAPGLTSGSVYKWGQTLGGAYNVWRSGLGVTKDGALVYVGGPAMSITDLASVLIRAGAVTAMELDINTDWVSYATYDGPLGAPVTGASGTNLLPGMVESPSHYFDAWWSRDFYTMSLRANALSTTKP